MDTNSNGWLEYKKLVIQELERLNRVASTLVSKDEHRELRSLVQTTQTKVNAIDNRLVAIESKAKAQGAMWGAGVSLAIGIVIALTSFLLNKI